MNLNNTIINDQIKQQYYHPETSMINDFFNYTFTKSEINNISNNKAIIHPEIIHPETIKPEIIHPETIKPEIIHPETIKPEIIHPETIKPEIIHPEMIQPEMIKPEMIKPAIINPDIINPAIINPDIINPDIINPAIINPAIINPDIINPDIIKPAIIKPEIPHSKIIKPIINPQLPTVNTYIIPQQYDHSLYTAYLAGLDINALLNEHTQTNIKSLNLNYKDKEKTIYDNYKLIIIALVILIIFYLFI